MKDNDRLLAINRQVGSHVDDLVSVSLQCGQSVWGIGAVGSARPSQGRGHEIKTRILHFFFWLVLIGKRQNIKLFIGPASAVCLPAILRNVYAAEASVNLFLQKHFTKIIVRLCGRGFIRIGWLSFLRERYPG